MQRYRILTYFLITLIVLSSASCASHEQFQTYLTDKEDTRPEAVASPLPENVEEAPPHKQDNDEFVSSRKVYSIPLLHIESVQKGNVKVLKRAKRDLETFLQITQHLRKYEKTRDLAFIETYVREYIAEGIDSLLGLDFDINNTETETLRFEIQYLKALLFYEIKDIAQACKTLQSMDEQYSENSTVDVAFIAGRLKTESSHMVMANFKHMCHDSILKQIQY